jgi:hypothetical protein
MVGATISPSRARNNFPELTRGHDLLELADNGYDFPQLRYGQNFPELTE